MAFHNVLARRLTALTGVAVAAIGLLAPVPAHAESCTAALSFVRLTSATGEFVDSRCGDRTLEVPRDSDIQISASVRPNSTLRIVFHAPNKQGGQEILHIHETTTTTGLIDDHCKSHDAAPADINAATADVRWQPVNGLGNMQVTVHFGH
jgi:hypothetical protein